MGRLFYDYYNHQVGVYHIIKKRFKFIALGLLSALFLFLAISHVSAATTVNVTPASLNGWTAGTTTGGTVTFVPNGTAPSGTGVLRLTTTSDNDSRANISLPVNKNLSDVTSMSMESRQVAAGHPEINASYRVTIDADGNESTTNDVATLIYEPYWHDGLGNADPIVADTWQTWDAKAGKFWASISGGNSVPGLVNGGGGPPLYTVTEVLDSNPNALVTKVTIGLGSYNPSSDILVDNFIFDDTTYDFEPAPPIEPPEAATQTDQVVLQSDFANAPDTWTYHDDNEANPLLAADPSPTANHEVSANPAPGPSDNGAVNLNSASGDRWNLASLQYSGTKLADIAELGFSLYTDNPGKAYINLDVDFNHPSLSGWQGRLVYVPAGVISNTWGEHEAVDSDGEWEWSRMITGAESSWPDGDTSESRNWNEIINAFPDATVTAVDNVAFGSLYLRADGISTTYYDHVYLATNTENINYNFELPDTTKPIISVNPEAPKLISGVQNFTITVTDESLDPDDNKQIWVELYGDPDWSQKKGAKVDLSSGTGIFTIDTNNLADGKYVLRVGSVVDAAGNTSGDKSFKHFTIDNTAPNKPQMLGFYKGHGTPSGDIIPCGGFTNNPQIRITWEENSESDIDYYWLGTKFNPKHKKVFNKTFYNGNMTPGNNPYHYTVIAVDKAGNESEISDQCGLVLDQVAPVVTVTPLSGDGILHGTVTFDITVTDDNLDPSILDRIWTYLYNNNPPQNPKGANIDLSSGHGTFTVNTKLLDDGAATLDVGKLYDAAGNPSGTGDNYFSGYTIDNTAPDVNNVILNGESVNIARDHNCGPTDFNLVNGIVNLSANISDDLSGVKNAKYKIRKVTDGGCTQTGIYQSGTVNMSNSSADNWITLPGSELDTNDVPADGNYTVMMTVADNTGNSTTKYIDITVDNTAPNEPEANPPAGIYTGPQDIDLSSSDSLSGLDKIYYTLDGSEPNDTSGTEYSGPISITEDTILKAISYDNANNASSILTAEYGIAPIISGETATDPITTESITITWTTDKPATSRVVYDVVSHPGTPDPSSAPNYGYAFSTVEDSTKDTSHSVVVPGLTPGTTYYFRTVSHGSPEAVSDEISASTDEESISSPQSTGGGGGDGSFTAAGFNTTPFNTFGTFGTTTPAPGGGNVLNANDGDNDGNDEENTGEVQADAAGVSSATTAEEASKSSWSWWWILPIIAALLLLFAILRRRGDEEEA